ncbi:MAG TPA: DUF2207 domain-containing protein [Burkholderiales bacterium]|jgi:uncharacterized membrane protein YgcG
MMRRLLFAVMLLLSGAAGAGERILSFDSRIEIRPEGSLIVTETLRVRAEGDRIRRGIFREFPTLYTDRRGNRTTVSFAPVSVRRDGAIEPYHTARRSNGVALYIGDKDRFLSPGEYTYEIRYRTDRQLGFFPEHDELYWNVTGVDWDFPIDAASAEVLLPAGASDESVRLEGYTGPMGAKWQNYRALLRDGVARFETTRPLAPREGLTIVVMWPKGLVSAPSASARLRHFLRDNRPLTFGALGLLCVLGYYLLMWRRVGRDPAGDVVIPRYQPPEGETPASMRYLQRMAYDNRCFVAGILGLAVKGYLTIEQQGGGFLKKGKYTLHRTRGSQTPLGPDEHALLREVLGARDTLLLDDENHAILRQAKSAHEVALKRKYLKSFFHVNGKWHALGIFLTGLAVALGVVAPAIAGGYGQDWFLLTPGGWATITLGAVALIANAVFGRLLKAPTREGRKRLDQIEGFRLYLDVAEGDELKLAGAPRKTPGLFEAYLPFALALGVEQRWSQKFAGVFLTQGHSPDWYHGDRWDANDLGGFSSSLSSSFDSAVSSASTAPGDSSGGGGGGSSGGGGGGGGGGGW